MPGGTEEVHAGLLLTAQEVSAESSFPHHMACFTFPGATVSPCPLVFPFELPKSSM